MSSGFKIWRHLPLLIRQWSLITTTNEIVTTSKRLETASHGMETSKKWGLRSPTKSERNHNEVFCCHQIFNMLKICQRTRQITSAVCGRYRIRQRQLTAARDDWRQIQNCNSQLNVACRYPLFVIVWARLKQNATKHWIPIVWEYMPCYHTLIFKRTKCKALWSHKPMKECCMKPDTFHFVTIILTMFFREAPWPSW